MSVAFKVARSRRDSYDSDSDERYVPIVVGGGGGHRRGSERPGRKRSPDVVNNTYLNLPETGRRRAASTSGAPQPNVNIYVPSSERSRSRSRYGRSSDSESDHSRSHSRRRHSRSHREDNLTYEQRKALEDYRHQKDKEQWEAQYEDEKNREKARKDKIIKEAKEAEARKKIEDEELRKKILEEAEAKKLKDKAKKEEEEKEFEDKVKEKFRRAGYSDEHIEEVLHRKKESHHSDREWAIDLSRPTFIKVHRKYLLPDTLDAYSLPWEWDKRDNDYIIIKKYVDSDFQDILFEHTKMIIKKRKLITPSYTKKTTVELKPSNVYKEDDKLYVVRTKSKSPSRERRKSWIFT